MKTLKIALFSTAIAFAPAAYAQVVDQPTEAEEQAPETTQDTDATDTQAPETTENEEASPEVSHSDDTYSEPMAL
jgi:hypothetical protein